MAASEPAAVREPYRLAADTIGSDEIEAAKAVLDSGQLTMGPRVRAFEEQFAAWVGAKHAVMVNSGSSANLLVVDALMHSARRRPRLEAGDEVLIPGLSWPTTAWPIAQLGLVPVFVDVDHSTIAVDLASAGASITARTRAMFLIHPLGRALDLDAYTRFCDERGLDLIEDCCESLGAFDRGRHVGTAGLAGTYSFYFSHHVSTIEGGMIVTDDLSLADDLRSQRAHGWIRDRSDRARWIDDYPEFDPRFMFVTMGYNVRPTEINAAMGSIQLTKLDQMLFARESLARAVRDWAAAAAPWLELIGADALSQPTAGTRSGRTHSWMTLPMRILPDSPVPRDTVTAHLERAGVETRPIIAGNLARHPAVRGIPHRTAESMAECDALLERGFMIGCHPILSAGSLGTLEAAIASLATL